MILPVHLGTRSYTIHIGIGLLERLGQLLHELHPLVPNQQIALVSNTTVAPLYLAPTTAALQAQGYHVLPIILPDGEQFKNSATLNHIFDTLIAQRCERSTTMVALGGGVIGDMAGFAAACFLRGIDFIQVPTTLLAQVDASVGGKTGINHPLGKNLIGAFHQPKLVVIDINTLHTLAKREFIAGLAEVIKHGAIADRTLFDSIALNLETLLQLEPTALLATIRDCCTIKARIVANDERESGQRALLNFGHTFGHAIETLTAYQQFLHGEAVAIGMGMAARLSHLLGLCPEQEVEQLCALMARAGLPTKAPRLPVEQYLEAMSRDKKVEGQVLRFILLKRIGHATIYRDPPHEAIREAIELSLA